MSAFVAAPERLAATVDLQRIVHLLLGFAPQNRA